MSWPAGAVVLETGGASRGVVVMVVAWGGEGGGLVGLWGDGAFGGGRWGFSEFAVSLAT